MGALILTRGTRHLIRHFNTEFKDARLRQLRRDTIDGSATRIVDAFDDATTDLSVLTQIVKHGHSGRGDKKCLLPDDNSNGQPHLESRWIHFLNSILTARNHQKIRKAIVDVLKDPSFDYIEFDCIEIPASQEVFISVEFDKPESPNPKKYLRIVLGTPPMSKYAGNPNLELDPQSGYTFTLAPPEDNGDTGQGGSGSGDTNTES